MRHLALALVLAPATLAGEAPPLPPVPPWDGASRSLVRQASDPWVTPAEASAFRLTPGYDETMAWLRRLADATPQVKLVTIGRSGTGRDIWMVVASAEGASTPEAVRANGRPVVLAQAGIHAGEIDGKDAGLMLLRDLTVAGRLDLLQRVNFLLVPMLNPDGHEDVRPFGRINQRGPDNAGWRTTATNLNVNRDYTKLDAPETRAVVAALDAWGVELYLDLHVTDGGDYQYDVTYGGAGRHARSPAIGAWMEDALGASLDKALAAAGHVPGPLWVANIRDDQDPSKGFDHWPIDARLSHTYGDARHLPTVLVENHSLKPYERRVLSNVVLLESTLRHVAQDAAGLRAAVASDLRRRDDPVTLSWKQRTEPVMVDVLAMSWTPRPAGATGGPAISWTGTPRTETLPLYPADVVERTAKRPKAYFIPGQWTDVIDRVVHHGIVVERLDAPREVDVEACRLVGARLGTSPFEGRVRLDFGGKSGGEPWSRATEPGAVCTMEARRERLPAGSVRVPTDQPRGTLAVLLLEAASQDSFLQWGFFHHVLQRTEYVEAYVMDPLADTLLAADPALRAEYERWLGSQPDATADERRSWLYRRTPYADDRYLLYPVFREP